MVMEMTIPVLKTWRPLAMWEAIYWDRAVWMEPAHKAKQIPNMGCTILYIPSPSAPMVRDKKIR